MPLSFRLLMKLAMLVIVATGIAAIALIGTTSPKSALVAERKDKVRDLVQIVGQMLMVDHETAVKSGLREDEAKLRAKAILRNLSFGNGYYFYALDSRGIAQAHPNPKLEGVSMWDMRDDDGVYFARELIVAAHQGGGFVNYRFPRARGEAPLGKIGYAAVFQPLDWTIGTGVYLDDIDATCKTDLWRAGLIIAIVLAASVVASPPRWWLRR